MGGIPFIPVFPPLYEEDQGMLVRVATKEIDLRSRPNDEAPIIGKRLRDQVVHVYEELHPADAPAFYNTLWYRVWGGYIHSAHVQTVGMRFNQPVESIPEAGRLCEVTVPYTIAYQFKPGEGWFPWKGSRLYYGTTHWATGVTAGPDGEPWYQITSEIDAYLIYYAPAVHIRLIPEDEFSPLSPNVPPEKKKIEIHLPTQTLTALEYGKPVFSTKISSGIPNPRLDPGEIPTATPKGKFNIYSKMPNKHMGSVTGNPDAKAGFSLPGVPWTSFFGPVGGVAFHGTYWHTNFGLQMSHGCINMRNEDAKWLFRWSTPVFKTKIESHADWEVTGFGTTVYVDDGKG